MKYLILSAILVVMLVGAALLIWGEVLRGRKKEKQGQRIDKAGIIIIIISSLSLAGIGIYAIITDNLNV